MNLQLNDIFTGQQPSRQWTPLISQQLRLRHLYRVTAYNVITDSDGDFYYTLHQTSMSAPFYTSEKVSSCNPRWAEIRLPFIANSAVKACVLRIWQTSKSESDKIVLAWGINFSGLVYLGNKLADVQPSSFKDNTVILHLHSGYFTSSASLRTDLQTFVPFIDHLNIVSTEDNTKVYRTVSIRIPSRDIKKSYNVEKLRRLQSLQLTLKNKNLELDHLRNRISKLAGYDEDNSVDSESPIMGQDSGIRYEPQPLTMNSLNKLLHEKPTKFQKSEIIRISKEVEASRLKIKLLSQQKDKQVARVRQLKETHIKVYEKNQETESTLMESYRQLSKEVERLRNSKREQIHLREILLEDNGQLYRRRKQLLNQLLDLYPIETNSDQKYNINNVYLPNSELLNDCSQDDVAVALGFVAHILVMCSNFLQVPLRYPIIHMGSRSIIIDHISPCIADCRQQYPLYLRGKDRYQFNYAVCLLNKNIAQLRWICGLHTQNLKATLPNLLTFLLQTAEFTRPKPIEKDTTKSDGENNGKHDDKDSVDGSKKYGSIYSSTNSIPFSYVSAQNASDPILESLKLEYQEEKPFVSTFKPSERPAPVKVVQHESSLSQVLAIPEAFLTQQISPNSFKSYMNKRTINEDIKIVDSTRILNCDIVDGLTTRTSPIEQGVDLTDPVVCEQLKIVADDGKQRIKSSEQNIFLASRRLSRSVGSYDEEKESDKELSCSATGSDSILTTAKMLPSPVIVNNNQAVEQGSRVQEWLINAPLESTRDMDKGENILTERADALLNTTSFHLVKPK
ncbi:UV radiation resistance-associated protein [Onthophagus taurus]|uniref:UV radiation resistance-associated protein n=1 Tax=Onthophagus taurus TaxID=166361 RepID=UPI0039BE4CDE